jgi:uncharacterized membrane protein
MRSVRRPPRSGGAPSAHSGKGAARKAESFIEAGSLGFERLVFFSDAVFAIAVTLLTLDIRPALQAGGPSGLRAYLPALGGQFIIYILSFVVVSSFWFGHHRIFGYFRRIDRTLILLNLLFLLFVAAVPIPTRLLGQFGGREANILYAGYMGLTSLIQAFLWSYAAAGHRLIRPEIDTRFGNLLSYTGPVIFFLSIPLALFSLILPRAFWLTIWLAQGVERRIFFERWRGHGDRGGLDGRRRPEARKD